MERELPKTVTVGEKAEEEESGDTLWEAKLPHPRSPLLVHDAFDLPVRDPHVVLALRLQRNLTAEQSSLAVVVGEAVQIIAVA